MDLILWRHAEAEDWPEGQTATGDSLGGDLERSLTSRGEIQAIRIAKWLDRQLPDGTRILVSPARRCQQTALALGRKYKICTDLAPAGTPAQLLELVQWPFAKSPVLIVGHQPTLGQTIAQLLGLQKSECAVKKGAVWWLRYRTRQREHDKAGQTVVVTVQSPEIL